jgi:magnesium-protoporphyrin O-methyltransferase
MPHASYDTRRDQLQTYFDDTAVEAWKRLTSEAPVSGIRATVRAGRDRMRQTLLDWLPHDLMGARVLDAGCGTGTLSVEAARRGADVVGIDLSPKLIKVALKTVHREPMLGSVRFLDGDMRASTLGTFDYVVCMDSLIHYRAQHIADALGDFAGRTNQAILFTFAPRTALLTAMHAVGRCFPRSDRAPAIEPVSDRAMRAAIEDCAYLGSWQPARTERVNNGFYMSQAMELVTR